MRWNEQIGSVNIKTISVEWKHTELTGVIENIPG